MAYTSIRELTTSERELVSEHELTHLETYTSARRQQEYLCGRALLRLMLEDWTGMPAKSHRFAKTESGKPVCVDGPAVSITHSGGLVACVVADSGDIGIDLEAVNPRRNILKVAQKFYSQKEASWLETQPVDRFFMLWVLKEAYVKSMGRSIFGGINGLTCNVSPPHIEVINASDSFRELGLYQCDDMFLGLATTQASLGDVKIGRWIAGGEIEGAGNEFELLATTFNSENHVTVNDSQSLTDPTR
ncbi:MAG: 4'-phosphopantetheinyl transferase superfamily protein [Woeseiaceae bacterium]|nr:4'-phosphopantetheinyl transferase superfamily protein [Woeseiaceae bacterium]MDX2607635.1 4'-phosphopantetheinyl transferase superfamily protein [Woeseiaceae bacterium]